MSIERGGDVLLKQFRQKKHLTQQEVADMLQLTVRQYQRIEAGKSFPRQKVILLLEDLFQTPQRILLSKNFSEIPDYLKVFYLNCNTNANKEMWKIE